MKARSTTKTNRWLRDYYRRPKEIPEVGPVFVPQFTNEILKRKIKNFVDELNAQQLHILNNFLQKNRNLFNILYYEDCETNAFSPDYSNRNKAIENEL